MHQSIQLTFHVLFCDGINMRDGGADGIVFKPAAESNTMRIATKTKKTSTRTRHA